MGTDSLLVLLQEQGPLVRWVAVVVYVLLMRELLISGLREAGQGAPSLSVSILGKSKTMVQMVALFVLLAENAAGWNLNVGFYILTLAMVLSVLSFIEYLIRFTKAQNVTVSDDKQQEPTQPD